MYIHIYTHTHTYTQLVTGFSLFIGQGEHVPFVYMYTHTYIYVICTHIHLYMFQYIYIRSHTHTHTQLVTGLSLSIGQGEHVLIVGNSGTGKSSHPLKLIFVISNSLLHFLPRTLQVYVAHASVCGTRMWHTQFKCMWHTQELALARPIMETPELFSISAPTNSSPRTDYYMYMAHARARTLKLVIYASLSLRVSPFLSHTANRQTLSRFQNHYSKCVLKPLNFSQNLHPRTPSHELIICMRD